MSDELVLKKLEQISDLLDELERLLESSFEEFQKDMVRIRAAERDFQLIVDQACDINTQVLLTRGRKTPDTYRQSFSDLEREGILPSAISKKLALSAGLRNILVHEYDFDEDYEKFYLSAKELSGFYREYIKIIHKFTISK